VKTKKGSGNKARRACRRVDRGFAISGRRGG
jgi:hypothetical protein